MMRRLVAILLMILLPLQVQAAALMPVTSMVGMGQSVQAGAAELASAHDMSHCQHAVDSGDQSPPAGQPAGCDRCVLCHLAVAMFVMPDLAALPQARDYAVPAQRAHFSHIPEAPQRPPRHA